MAAHLDDIFTFHEQFLPILQLPHRVFPNGFQTTLNIIHLDRIFQFSQLANNITNLVDHQVRSKVTVDVVDRLKTVNASVDTLEYSFSRIHQCGGPFVTGFYQRKFSSFKSVINLFPLLCQLYDKLIEFSKTPFEFFELNHHLSQKFFALIRGIADVQVVNHGLIQQLHLRIKFGDSFDRH